jgi:hypothetical protein
MILDTAARMQVGHVAVIDNAIIVVTVRDVVHIILVSAEHHHAATRVTRWHHACAIIVVFVCCGVLLEILPSIAVVRVRDDATPATSTTTSTPATFGTTAQPSTPQRTRDGDRVGHGTFTDDATTAVDFIQWVYVGGLAR